MYLIIQIKVFIDKKSVPARFLPFGCDFMAPMGYRYRRQRSEAMVADFLFADSRDVDQIHRLYHAG